MKIKKICVFCGATTASLPSNYIELAKNCGEKIASLGLSLVYGGSKTGLMGIVSKFAFEGGAKVIGIYPKTLNDIDPISPTLTETLIVDSMYIRKEVMINISDAFLILPGGIGTLDEIFEVISLSVLRGNNKPIIFVNHNGYWDILHDLIKHVVDNNFASPAVYDTFFYAKDLDQAFQFLGFSS